MALMKIKIIKTTKTYNKLEEYIDTPINNALQLIHEGIAIESSLEEEKRSWWKKNNWKLFTK